MSDFSCVRRQWPFHSAHFWCGLLAGVGVGLLLGAALVELEALTTQRKAWVSLLDAVLVGVNRATEAAPNKSLQTGHAIDGWARCYASRARS